jgi:dTDP-4-dehydrorhamnose reductase
MKGLVLVTGSEGLVGSRFVELFPRKNFLRHPTLVEMDITNASSISEVVASYNLGAIVNFAAYTNVGEAEKERGDKNGACWQVNVEGTRNLVKAVNNTKIHFIQISTDMVFPGSAEVPGPYSEEHEPEKDQSKVTWYGYTKGEAERIVNETLGKNATIVRLIYPVRAKYDIKLDYLRKPLSLFDEGKLYPLFSDQQVSIAFIDEVCKALEKIIFLGHFGVYHAGSRDVTTPYELISYFLEKARGVKDAAKSISLDEFLAGIDNPVRYPKFGGLKVEETERKLGMRFRTWREIVDEIVRQMKVHEEN